VGQKVVPPLDADQVLDLMLWPAAADDVVAVFDGPPAS
jgi:hypothetical protein